MSIDNQKIEEFLTELRNRSNIKDVVSSYVVLKKSRGTDWVACCPFHNEKTPSFYVHEAQRYFHCFGCSKGGDVIKFIMEIEQVSFWDAVKILADRANMTLPEHESDDEYKKKKDRTEKLQDLMLDANRLYYMNLTSSDKGKDALAYLESRGFGKEIIDKYRLGVSLDEDQLYSFLRKKGYSAADIEACGLIYGDKHKDSFANRVIVPIYNAQGKVVAFGGRVYKEADKGTNAKYKNSNTNEVFEKSRMVYGLNYIRDARLKGEKFESLILVEGYMDVIALGAAGINNAIAGMGTALTDGQIREIKKNTQSLYVCYDGDEAGIKATNKNAPMLENAGLEIKIVCLPNGMDPDEVIKNEGVEGFKKYLEQGMSLIEYRLKRCVDTSDLTTPNGRTKYLKAAVVALSFLESETDLDIYGKIVAQTGQVTKDAVISEVKKYKLTHKVDFEIKDETPAPSKETDTTNKAGLSRVRFVINRMLSNAKYVKRAQINADWFTEPTAHAVVEWIKSKGDEEIIIGDLFAAIPQTDELNAYLDEWQETDSEINEEAKYKDCLKTIVQDYIIAKEAQLKNSLKDVDDVDKRREILQECIDLRKIKIESLIG